MRLKVKRCEVCASKLDKDEKCTWEGCPKSPKYETETKELEQPKEAESENKKGKK